MSSPEIEKLRVSLKLNDSGTCVFSGRPSFLQASSQLAEKERKVVRSLFFFAWDSRGLDSLGVETDVQLMQAVGSLTSGENIDGYLRRLRSIRADAGACSDVDAQLASADFAAFPRLEFAFLQFNGLSEFPAALFGARATLSALCLEHNSIARVPGEVAQLSVLQALNLQHNALESLPEGLCELSRLQVLEVGHNRLDALPEGLGRLTQLKVLDVSFNRLSALPDAIGALPALERLLANDNEISALPPLPPALQALIMQKNRVGTVAEGALPRSLRSLSLSFNLLEVPPPRLEELVDLAMLYLSNNRLRRLEIVKPLLQLKECYIGGNPFETLPVLSLHPQLEVLDLSRCRLGALDDADVKRLRFAAPKLAVLDLSENELEALPESLALMRQLRVLSLINNKLPETLPEVFHQKLKETKIELKAPPVPAAEGGGKAIEK